MEIILYITKAIIPKPKDVFSFKNGCNIYNQYNQV